MGAELGHLALWLAAAAAAAQAWLGLAPQAGSKPPQAQSQPPQAQSKARVAQTLTRLSAAQSLLLLAAFLLLMLGFVRSDFSLALVAAHSHAAKPLLYRITGLWGNHEGSMLLWCLVLALYGSAFLLWARRTRAVPAPHWRRVLGYQGALQSAFLLYVGLTSNPFRRLSEPPFEGAGLNPVLQDPALAAHPPFLYLGFVGLALAFCQALAFLHDVRAQRRASAANSWPLAPRAFGAALHVWLLPAWVCLTIGIALGSFWAYYELGWGGFWFWDPVENASLMPWLAATALLHSNLVLRARAALLSWVLLLAMAGFGLSLFGTFLVRAGLISSVHAFASDPTRGVFLLAILGGAMGWGLWRYARLRAAFAPSAAPPLGPRAGALMANNVFLLTALATILLGTLFPLLVEMLGRERLSVGAPYFTAVLTPFLLAMALLLPLGVRLDWRGRWRAPRRPLAWLLVAALGGGLAAWGLAAGAAAFSALAAVAAWLMAGAALDVGLQRPRPLRLWGRGLAHGALGVLLLGVGGASWLKQESLWRMAPGEARTIGGYELELRRVRLYDGPNFQSAQGELQLLRAGRARALLLPERRFYTAEQTRTTEAAFHHIWLGNIYVQLGERQPDGAYIVRAWLHPLVWLIWLGGGLMALGGALAWRWHPPPQAGEARGG